MPYFLDKNTAINIKNNSNSKMEAGDHWELNKLNSFQTVWDNIFNSGLSSNYNNELSEYLISGYSINKIHRVTKVLPTSLRATRNLYVHFGCQSFNAIVKEYSKYFHTINDLRDHKKTRLLNETSPRIGNVKIIRESSYSIEQVFPTQSKQNSNFINSTINKVNMLIKEDQTFLNGVVTNKIDRRLNYLISELSYFNPEAVEIELTDEKSIYFSFKINKKIIFIDYYLELENKEQEVDGDDSELLISVFKSNLKVFNGSGNFTESLIHLSDFLKNK